MAVSGAGSVSSVPAPAEAGQESRSGEQEGVDLHTETHDSDDPVEESEYREKASPRPRLL